MATTQAHDPVSFAQARGRQGASNCSCFPFVPGRAWQGAKAAPRPTRISNTRGFVADGKRTKERFRRERKNAQTAGSPGCSPARIGSGLGDCYSALFFVVGATRFARCVVLRFYCQPPSAEGCLECDGGEGLLPAHYRNKHWGRKVNMAVVWKERAGMAETKKMCAVPVDTACFPVLAPWGRDLRKCLRARAVATLGRLDSPWCVKEIGFYFPLPSI